ncbi:MAG: hypothetical protein P4L35_18940, partial [Ignavibacteriaceae bacterium]|nr:hypothetical protein [Ignavibacteriaceae bacterium]
MMKTLIHSLLLLQVLLLLNFYYLSAQSFTWAKSPVGSIFGSHISVDSKGNSYFTGHSYGTVAFDTIQYVGYNGIDIFLAKYDANGNCKWAKHAGSDDPDHDPWGDYGCGTSIDAKGNCYLSGYFLGEAFFDTIKLFAYGWEDIFIAKYDSNGNCLWEKNAGGTERNHGYGISVDPSGNSYLTGSFSDTATFGTIRLISYGDEDIFLAKYDTYGNCLWAKHAGGSSRDVSYSISIDACGNSYITGLNYETVIFDTIQLTGTGGFIAKYDSSGNCQWV